MSLVAPVAPLLRSFGITAQTNAPTLSVSDHGDNTGATATIAATASDSTNLVYYQPFTGNPIAANWQLGGARLNDGDVILSLPAGHYFAMVASEQSGATSVSAIVYFAVTDGLTSLHARCLAAARERIRLLLLDGMPDNHIVIHKLPVNRTAGGGPLLPAIVLSPQRFAMPVDSGTNGLDDVAHDVLVSLFDRDNQESTLALNLDRHLLWRQNIVRAFRNQRLPGVDEVINTEVEPAEGLLEAGWKNEMMVSALRLRFIARETRGLD